MIIATLLGVMMLVMLLGFPKLVAMILAPLVVMLIWYPFLDPMLLVQQLVSGVNSFVMLAIPLFIFAADIMSRGQIASRMINMVRSCMGRLPGGMAVSASGACLAFGAVSGSTMATLAAIGRPLYGPLRKAGYSESHALGMLVTNATISLLIPPSIALILYAISTGTSVGELFIAGIAPGILMFLAWASYDVVFAKIKKVGRAENPATFKEALVAIRKSLLPLGFPVVILGGIYSGIFSPTEAAAISVLYAIILEVVIYRSLKFKDLPRIALGSSMVTAAVYILVAGGQAFSWVITFARVPHMLVSGVFGPDPSPLNVLIVVTIIFFVACMFLDSIPVIIILGPIFAPVAAQAGVDPIHMGIIVVFQAALSCVTPPFGCNIFTAVGIFNKPVLTVLKGTIPYVLIGIGLSIIFIFFPGVALFSRNLFF